MSGTPENEKKNADPYWWTPWAVLVALVVYGFLGFLGVLTPKRGGPTAADVPVTPPTPAPSAKSAAPRP